jgi:hypothetical protein
MGNTDKKDIQKRPDIRRGETAVIFAIVMGLLLGVLIRNIRIGVIIGVIIGLVIILMGWLRTFRK